MREEIHDLKCRLMKQNLTCLCTTSRKNYSRYLFIWIGNYGQHQHVKERTWLTKEKVERFARLSWNSSDILSCNLCVRVQLSWKTQISPYQKISNGNQDRRKQLLPVLKQAIANNRKTVFAKDTLFIDWRLYRHDQGTITKL